MKTMEKSKTKTLDFSGIFLGPKKNFINKKESKDNFFSKINLTNDFANEAVTKLIEGEIIASYLNEKNRIQQKNGWENRYCFNQRQGRLERYGC